MQKSKCWQYYGFFNFVSFRQVVLGFDEIKIHEGLVFDVGTGNIIGYVDSGDMNSKFKSFEEYVMEKSHEKEVATHMLTLCVRGIFMKMDYPIGYFPTTGIVYVT